MKYEVLKFAPQKRKRTGVFLRCEACAVEFYVYPGRLRQAAKNGSVTRYCSMKCYATRKGEAHPLFGLKPSAEVVARLRANAKRTGFKADHTNPNVIRFGADFKHIAARRLRGRLLDEAKSKCARCEYDEYPEVLEIHHKDRNRKNNDRSNLVMLCPTCHSVDHYLAKDGAYAKLKKA